MIFLYAGTNKIREVMDGEKMENYKVIGKELSNDQAYAEV